jgi:hypothetical protein
VAQLYSQAQGFLFIASYNLQGYGTGVRTRLQTGVSLAATRVSESGLLYDWQFTTNQFVLAPSPLGITTIWQLVLVI